MESSLAKVTRLALANRKVRTPGGVKHFGQPVGSIIVADGALAKLVRSTQSRTPAPSLVPVTSALQQVLDATTAAGGKPLLVGGSVRDAILDPTKRPKDIDIEVHNIHDTDKLVANLGQVGKVDAVGRAFGVLKVTKGQEDFDVSLPRRDSKVGTGHKGFEVTVDPNIDEKDATGRRDFTINSMMWDPQTHELVDHWGGATDLKAGVLKHVTGAFSEDPLRVLRGAQFASRFNLTMHPDTVKLAQSLASQHPTISKERVATEWRKLVLGRKPSAGLAVLRDTNWIDHYPEMAKMWSIEQDPKWHPEGNVGIHMSQVVDAAVLEADKSNLQGDDRFVVVLAALLHDLGKATHTQHNSDGSITSQGHAAAGIAPATQFMDRIGVPQAIVQRVLPLIQEHMTATSGHPPTPAGVRRLARRLAPATLEEWSMVVAADHRGRNSPNAANPADPWLALARTLSVQARPAPPLLSGHDLIAAGLNPGPSFAPIMKAAVIAQDSGEFTTKQGAKDWLTNHLWGK